MGIKVRKVKAKAETAEILIHQEIGENWLGDGITSKRMAEDLSRLGDVKTIQVRINSPGGSVSDGVGIYNILRAHGARIEVVVEGLAASIASIIAMAGDSIHMGDGALMMIHSPWTLAMGSAEDMRETADVLDKFEDALIDIYAKRTGKDREELKQLLAAETWMSGDEAVAGGFATSYGEDTSADATARAAAQAQFQTFSTNFRRPTDLTPGRIAAALYPSANAELQETQMEDEVKKAAEAAAKAQRDAAVKAALAADNDRKAQIRAVFEPFKADHADLLVECLSDSDVSAEAASTKLLAAVAAKQVGPLSGGHVSVVADSRDKFLAGAEQAILARAGLAKREAGNEFHGQSLADLSAHALGSQGISVKGMTKDQIARKVLASHTTSDFPLLLANTAGKVLRNAYNLAPVTWSRWCKTGSVSDFKAASRLTIGSFSNLLTKLERAEYQQGTVGEERETITAITKGRYISLSREMIVNDDLAAFTGMAARMGRAAARTVEADVYTLLTSASGAGPTMSDTGAFFNTTAVTTAGGHANLAGSGTAISVASIALGESAMMVQRDKTLNDYLAIAPRVLVCSPAKKQIAWETINSLTDVSQSNAAKRNYVAQLNLEVVASPYLSGNPWYLFADPADVEAFEVAFLDGVSEPFVDEEIEFMTDAMNMKVRLDYGIAAIDWRAGYRNPGA
jgi:ATP-dependent protease ClpP protease subunit